MKNQNSRNKIEVRDFRHNMPRDYLVQCLKATPQQRLAWLEEINQFTKKTVPLAKRRLWDKFRRGEI